MMVNILSMIIATLSLFRSLISANFTGWISNYIELTKKHDATVQRYKYHGPLIISAYDLQLRLINLLENLLAHINDEDAKDSIYIYTSFLIGQYFSCADRFQKQLQLHRSSDNDNLRMLLDAIGQAFAFCTNADVDPFMMSHDQQIAIAEIMTIKDEDGESCCLSYLSFHEKYCNDLGFKKWFRPIEKGIDKLVIAREEGNAAATFRLRKLQHHLVDFILVLNLETSALIKGVPLRDERVKAVGSPGCTCLRGVLSCSQGGKVKG